MARRSLSLVALVVFTGLACAGLQGKPVPADRRDLVGTWTNTGITLVLTGDGGVHYEKIGGSGHVTIDGPVTEWTPDGFVVGVFGVGTTFHVEDPPHVVDDPGTSVFAKPFAQFPDAVAYAAWPMELRETARGPR